MRIKVRFKLSEGNSMLADALRLQLSKEEGIELSLDEIVHRLFVNWMHSNLNKEEAHEGTIDNQSGADSTSIPTSVSGDTLHQPEKGSSHSE